MATSKNYPVHMAHIFIGCRRRGVGVGGEVTNDTYERSKGVFSGCHAPLVILSMHNQLTGSKAIVSR